MSYVMQIEESATAGKNKFVNAKGNTECVEFVRQVTDAPGSPKWVRGKLVKGIKAGELARGTAIATFDENGKYPTDSGGRHAAIYLSHSNVGIEVLDQWNAQGEVLKRTIRFNKPEGTSRSNDGDTFYVIE
jgi:hypothetical protein